MWPTALFVKAVANYSPIIVIQTSEIYKDVIKMILKFVRYFKSNRYLMVLLNINSANKIEIKNK